MCISLNYFDAKSQTTVVVCFDIEPLGKKFINSVTPDETAHDEPSHLDLCCLQKPIIIVCGGERIKGDALSNFTPKT